MENPITDAGGWSDRYASQVLSLLRIVTALLFLEHGTSKMFAFPLSAASDPPIWSLFWVAGAMELVGGLLLLVGLFSRPVALLLSGEMAIGYWLIHAAKGPFPILNGGESAVLFCFVFLYIAFEGPGEWSVDCAMGRRRDLSGPNGYYESGHVRAD
ncbi:DoxX family protein [Sphingomonas sp. ASV193]|uniref:DoxX family protein n=1 Tax=Sphingomonas sp. ASV193 TaxID=3144405 RepID=UPI0032E850A3